MKREEGQPAVWTISQVESAESRRARLVRSARTVVTITWLVYACLTAAVLVLMFFFYRFGDYGDCFAPTPCPSTLPPDPVMIALGLGAAGLAFVMGSLVAWLPTRRVFAISGVFALAITGSWLAVGLAPSGDPNATVVCFLSGPALIGSWAGWRNSVVPARRRATRSSGRG
jgi:hypothetical protein